MRFKMTLSEKQRKFTKLVGMLISWAYEHGYELTFGDAYAHDGHMKGSLHYSRLAIDFNLYKDGIYLTDTEDYKELGQFWESLGTPEATTAWGGRFKKLDGNHFSIEHEGRA